MAVRDSMMPFPLLPQVLSGDTADVYFLRARQILAEAGNDPFVGMEIFARREGICCGVREVAQLLRDVGFDGELRALAEGEKIISGEPVIQIYARYSSFGIYETAILGMLAASSAWATAAREVVDAAGPIPVVSFGARHLHPNVASVMDYAAVIGGCVSCSTPCGAALAGTPPSGTMPHAYVLIVGDTVEAADAFDRVMPANVPRVVLVDTFQDEGVESLRVAAQLGERLDGVRLDTPSERGGVTAAMVHEIRARLDAQGYDFVNIHVSGGMTPDRVKTFNDARAPVDSFGVGSYISGARPMDYTGDIREIEGRPVSKRGRIPGMRRSARLKLVLSGVSST